MTSISRENPLTSKDAQALLAMLPAGVEIERGMSERELDQVEERWGFRFAPEHRTLLGAGLPTGSRSWPDWRDGRMPIGRNGSKFRCRRNAPAHHPRGGLPFPV
ncbi:hypothetical protein ACFWFI_16710 [Streptomyces sp. NPDC060209]|uniref:hypothetical protein n=1 Tax=Streptomyces sp. NPDC060209 TaxID=3347073 RepID=UPI0036631EF7